ncbi:E3 ubiquitin-protein ligase RNF170 isoform X2 [Eutrema salsugineum]|uniref:E3 ubiquitin-protein ligase RNF170 isoform X2 n=1 Tax=Eutrema salsugineum TaxID=72664 RepID=UPI000CECFC92|nr:E3 ubiquitin-protein ligase RNF170 isoform X2 [Eutrema salsugineum]
MEVTTDDVLPEVNAAVAEILDRNDLVEGPNAAVLADGVLTAEERKIETDNRGERKTESETPPEDDCCPICFSSFTVPCRGNCGHWYCGSCILQYWSYAAVSRPCKCPMCVRHITKLSPEASLQQCQEQEVKEVLAKVRRYNRLFVGGLTGFVQVHELPLLMKRLVWHMMDPDANNLYFHEVRIFAMFMSTLYTAAEFNFIPTGGFRIVTVFDYAAIAMILILRLVGIYRRRRLAQRVRHLAAAELEPE